MHAIFRSFWPIAIGLLISSSSLPAYAEFVTYTASIAPQLKTDFGVSLSVPAFNTSLGSLKDVVISYVDSSSMQGTVTNGAASAQSFTVSETVNFGLTLGGTQLLSNDLTGKQSYTNLAVNATANFGGFAPAGGSANPFVIVDGPMFDAFQGPTPNITFQFGTLTTTKIDGGGGNITTLIHTNVDAMLTVTYEYGIGPTVEPAVPEPASLILTGLGGLLVVSGRMVRRKVGAKGPAGR